MVDKTLKLILKVIVLVWLVRYLAAQLPPEMETLLLPLIFLGLALFLVKRWFPFLYNFMKRAITWIGKATATRLWKKGEKKGGASVREPRMRWKKR